MARIRTVKPDFWTDERIGQCSPLARLLFIASWNFADDHGGIGRSAKQLKAQAFPYDALDCEPLIQELLDTGLLVEYAVEGKTYLHIKGFRKHQRQDNVAAPRFPVYREESRVLASDREIEKEVASNGEDSQGSRGDSALLLEGKVRESKGNKRARARGDPPPLAEPVAGLNPTAWTRWLEYRVAIRKTLKPVSYPAAQRELAAFGDDQLAVVEQAVARGWTGLFPLSSQPKEPTDALRPTRYSQLRRKLDEQLENPSSEESLGTV